MNPKVEFLKQCFLRGECSVHSPLSSSFSPSELQSLIDVFEAYPLTTPMNRQRYDLLGPSLFVKCILKEEGITDAELEARRGELNLQPGRIYHISKDEFLRMCQFNTSSSASDEAYERRLKLGNQLQQCLLYNKVGSDAEQQRVCQSLALPTDVAERRLYLLGHSLYSKCTSGGGITKQELDDRAQIISKQLRLNIQNQDLYDICQLRSFVVKNTNVINNLHPVFLEQLDKLNPGLNKQIYIDQYLSHPIYQATLTTKFAGTIPTASPTDEQFVNTFLQDIIELVYTYLSVEGMITSMNASKLTKIDGVSILNAVNKLLKDITQKSFTSYLLQLDVKNNILQSFMAFLDSKPRDYTGIEDYGHKQIRNIRSHLQQAYRV